LFCFFKSIRFFFLKFQLFSKLTGVGNNDLLGTFPRLRSIGFNLLDDFHALDDLSEDNMLAIQPRSLGSADKELRTVGVGSSVGHAEDARAGVLELEVLVLELVAIDGLASSAVVVGEVSALAHEVGDDAVEGRALVPESLLSGAEGAEILSGLRHHIGPQLHDDPADGVATGSDVKKYTGTSHDFGQGCLRYLRIR